MIAVGDIVRHTKLSPGKVIVGVVLDLIGGSAARVQVDHSKSVWDKNGAVICSVANLELIDPVTDTSAPAAYYNGLMKIIDELG